MAVKEAPQMCVKTDSQTRWMQNAKVKKDMAAVEHQEMEGSLFFSFSIKGG
jgi:hypothetical protein